MASSASEVRRLILQGGIYLNDERLEDPYQTREVRPGDELVVRKGRREYRVLRFRPAGEPGGRAVEGPPAPADPPGMVSGNPTTRPGKYPLTGIDRTISILLCLGPQ